MDAERAWMILNALECVTENWSLLTNFFLLGRRRTGLTFWKPLSSDFHGFAVDFWQSMNSELFSHLNYAHDMLPSSYSLLYLCSHLTNFLTCSGYWSNLALLRERR